MDMEDTLTECLKEMRSNDDFKKYIHIRNDNLNSRSLMQKNIGEWVIVYSRTQ